MAEPTIIIGSTDEGLQNKAMSLTQERLRKGKQYTDLSTVLVIPSRGPVHVRVVESWWNLQSPMNNRFIRLFITGMEIGDAYEAAVATILGHPELKNWKFMLTMETDNMPPMDGLLKLYENICHCPKLCTEHYAQVAGLYFTKGEGGQPMIYGNPKQILQFQPQLPVPDKVQECNGTGMGFTLFRLDMFKDKKIERPWFKTVQGTEGMGTQDLYFMGKARRAGYRIASDNRVRVGHYDEGSGIVW